MFSCIINSDITLRVLEARHAPELFSLTDSCRGYLRQWLPWVDDTRKVEDTRRFIEGALRQYAQGNGFQAGIWYRGKIAGVIGYHHIDWRNRQTSVGYWLGKEYQGRGIMTMACRAVVDHAFTGLGLHRAEIRCAVDNAKSRAIPLRLGLREEGVVRGAEWLYDRFVDHVIYGVLAPEWMRED